jgi:DNA-binding protein HU-beta
VNRRELVKAVAAHTGVEPKQVDEVVRGMADVITGVVAKGEAVTMSGFAKFAKVERAARMGRNPATGEQIRIKASKRARITPLKAFKESVMSPSKAPKLARGVWPLDESAATAKKATAKKATAKKATAKKATAKKATAKKATAKKATAKKAAAKKATAKKATAKKATAKKATAKKATSRSR